MSGGAWHRRTRGRKKTFNRHSFISCPDPKMLFCWLLDATHAKMGAMANGRRCSGAGIEIGLRERDTKQLKKTKDSGSKAEQESRGRE